MLRGENVILRARQEEDLPVLEAGLYWNVTEWNRASARFWRPIPPGSPESPYRIRDGRDETVAQFSVVAADGGELAGSCLLWGIDRHNRTAHLGISLLPAFRGKGLGADVVLVLCRYAFETIGLHRVQLETLADNEGMIRAAQRAGFRQEGRFTQACWVNGEFLDEVVYALLAADWRERAQAGPA